MSLIGDVRDGCQPRRGLMRKQSCPISWSWFYSSSNWETFLLFKPPWQSIVFYYGSPNRMISYLRSLFGAYLVMHITMWFSSFSVKMFLTFYLCGEDSLIWQEMVFSMVWHRGQGLVWWFLTWLNQVNVLWSHNSQVRKDPELSLKVSLLGLPWWSSG